MAKRGKSAEFLKKLRKKYRLGEYAKGRRVRKRSKSARAPSKEPWEL